MTTRLLRGVGAALLLLVWANAPRVSADTSLAGLWDATVVVNNVEIPFTFEIAGDGATVSGTFFNGPLKITSTSGKLDNGTLALEFGQYAAKLDATVKDGGLEGQYDRGPRGAWAFRATRHTPPVTSPNAPNIDGVWLIPTTTSNKGETTWRFIVEQTGPQVSSTILRIDGDTGAVTGTYRDGKFVLSHFAGSRPLLLEVELAGDGSLKLLQNKKTEMVAYRATDARAKDAGVPTDPSLHTRMKDPNERFRFSFPDLNGVTVSDRDPRFAGKVVLVSIGGSWCPNCHDEAPFLSKLYKTYHDKGLEIVGLSFEEDDQLTNPERLRAFIKKYDIEYTMLLAGEPDQLNEKVTQAENLNSFPTTFLLGRDGRVRAVHAGFPSPGSADFYEHAVADITQQVERLLAERVPSEVRQ